MKTLEEVLKKNVDDAKTFYEQQLAIYTVCETAGILDIECAYAFTLYENDVYINAPKLEHCRAVVKRLLPLVGTFEKTFNEYGGRFAYSGMHNGIKLTVTTNPTSACRIEKQEVEETVTTVEKRVKYVLVGDCDPLLDATPEPSASE